MSRISKIIIIFLYFFINYTQTYSQDSKDTLSIEDYYNMSLDELMDIEISSASKIVQKQSEAPNIITGITRNKIDQYNFNSINDILYSQPGFFPSYDYDRRTVGFRGMFEGWNNNHYLILIDGIPFNDNLYQSAYTWEITPLIIANSVEIIRGTGGALYGKNAMNGVITLNTYNADQIENIGTSNFRIESNNTQVYNFLVGNQNDRFGMILGINHHESEGNEYESYDGSFRTDSLGNLLQHKTSDTRSNSYLFAKLYGKGKLEGLSFQYHEQHWDYETGHGWLFSIPDKNEDLKEYQRILTLKYTTNKQGLFNWETALKYQKHHINWDLRFLPDNSDDNFSTYPKGISESLETNTENYWARLQSKIDIHNYIIIAGAESDIFIYNGDENHSSNVNLNLGEFSDSNYTEFTLDPWFEYIHKQPVNNLAFYLQVISPKVFNKLQFTISGRYDQMFFNYINDITNPTKPKSRKTFKMFTPRVALVYILNNKITLKAIYSKAFRTPSPTEMFGSNTYTLASNIENIEPEKSDNIDIALDWNVNTYINFKLNAYWVQFDDIIAYSEAVANLSTNVFSQETIGFETELNTSFNKFSGFINYSYAHRLNEKISDHTIAESDSKVTWAPAHVINSGIIYNHNFFYSSLLLHYQSKVERRTSDFDGIVSNYRPNTIDSWTNLDFKFAYRVTPSTELGLIVKNLTNANRFLIKNYAYPFDYKLEKRSFLVNLLFKF